MPNTSPFNLPYMLLHWKENFIVDQVTWAQFYAALQLIHVSEPHGNVSIL